MRIKSILTMTGVVAAFIWISAMPAQAQPKPAAAAQTAPVCAKCHEAQWKSTDLTAHGAKNDADGGMCQSCHGDASAHIKDPNKVKPADPFGKAGTAETRTAVCLTCHSGNRDLAFWAAGKHQLNDVTCSNCHSIHGKALAPSINKFVTTFRPGQWEGCGNCHQQIRAAIFKPSHHPIIEGKVKCSDCHNPHGALSPAMVKQPTINDQCYTCHADKRGPYVFNHPPVEENCVTCHNPHGSVHAKLLNENAPNLCQDCHDWSRHPGTVYAGQGGWLCAPGDTNPACVGKTSQPNPAVNNRLVTRACLNCHNAIHGSNAPGNRGKYLTR
ncbi:MAG: DmsE family decaheme c-type cytochrome [Burkholderiales bacterium]|nr:DmsE family decaheme c-type cytochrome [Burkholderiales bacterium]